jgi:histidyl-tRNA synthetase
LGVQGVRQLLGEGRKDDSGDFTKGAGLGDQAIDALEKLYAHQEHRSQDFFMAESPEIPALDDDGILQSGNTSGPKSIVANPRFLDTYEKLFPDTALILEGTKELKEISRIVRAAGYGTRRIRIDVSVVRGLEYYTGPVYEVELLLETKDEKGRPVRFGSVGGGGRYDGLVSRFRGEPVPATGFSIGVSRLQAALTLIGKLDAKPAPGPVVVTVFDRERVADYQRMVAALRNARIRAELYLGNPKHSVGQQLKYADKRGSPCAIIQGPDEKAKGEVQIKDLILGATLTAIKDRDEYLRKQAEAQRAVPEDRMVDAVRQLLAGHSVRWD